MHVPVQKLYSVLYLLKQHNESFEIWSALIKNNTEGKSLIMKLGPDGKCLCNH